MQYITFDKTKPYDLILLGRVAVDFNPVDYYCPLNESTTFKRYLGGSPANIAVGLARLGKKIGFFARVSDDQLGTFVTDFFEKEGIDTSHIKRCQNGEKIGLTFTEIKSETESSILMYRNVAADLKLDVADIDEDYIRTEVYGGYGASNPDPDKQGTKALKDSIVELGYTEDYDIDSLYNTDIYKNALASVTAKNPDSEIYKSLQEHFDVYE